ncbi:MAG: hypothetical protein JWO40_14 [Candidatus Doudnabacteria bacterium]|nr:hypothetical protein [Candidatus Doudnabacteria bacterium]
MYRGKLSVDIASMLETKIIAKKKIGPLIQTKLYEDTKDPCVVFDGRVWHKFGSGGNVREEKWKPLHATALKPEGPWIENSTVKFLGLVSGEHVAAPGVTFDNGLFHMFIMTEFMGPGGTIEYLTSTDGDTFVWRNTTLFSRRKTDEAGLYDPHPAVIQGQKYLVYAAMPEIVRQGKFIIQPNVYLAKSKTNEWAGPWERAGKILDHADISWHHNQYDHPDYEWGIEGPQLIELPNKKILLNATCFLPTGVLGTRQRVFFALADKPEGPFESIGPIMDPKQDSWGSGENGHAAGFVYEGDLLLFYQARETFAKNLAKYWRYGLAIFDLKQF